MILCIGTTPTLQRTMTFARLTPDDVNRATHTHEHASGKAVNVARILHTRGLVTLVTGFIGGMRGQALIEDLTNANVPHDFVPTTAQTRLCTTLIDKAAQQVTELVEESPPATQQEWAQLISKIDQHLASAQTLVLSGTLAPGAPEDFLARWLDRTPRVILDAKGPPLLGALRHPTCIAKLNQDEFAQTLNVSIETEDQLLAHAHRHVPKNGLLVITRGRHGAIATTGQGRAYRAHPANIQPVSPIGSGDAFAAGLAAALTQSQDLPTALKLATACAAANALTPYSGVLRNEDVERLLPQIRVETI